MSKRNSKRSNRTSTKSSHTSNNSNSDNSSSNELQDIESENPYVDASASNSSCNITTSQTSSKRFRSTPLSNIMSSSPSIPSTSVSHGNTQTDGVSSSSSTSANSQRHRSSDIDDAMDDMDDIYDIPSSDMNHSSSKHVSVSSAESNGMISKTCNGVVGGMELELNELESTESDDEFIMPKKKLKSKSSKLKKKPSSTGKTYCNTTSTASKCSTIDTARN